MMREFRPGPRRMPLPGVADGVVQGSTTEEGAAFRGADAITFNEAATMLDRVLDAGDVDLTVWYADRQAVPTWAAQAVGNMEALNVLSAGSFGSDAMEEAVTRADAPRCSRLPEHCWKGNHPADGLTGWADWWIWPVL